MKIKKNVFLSIILLMVLTIGTQLYAQKEATTQEQLNYLTDKQRHLLKEQQALLDKTKAILKENLTDEQLALIKDRTLTQAQRTQLLRQSLSQEQRTMIANNRRQLTAKRTAFRNSLTKKQRFRLRKFLQRRSIDDRRRLARRLRRLIRDNIDR